MFSSISLISKPPNLESRLQLAQIESAGLHSSTRLTLLCGRILGMLPLSGLTNPRSDGLRFTLRSPYTVLYCASIVGQISMFCFSFYWLLQHKISLTNVTNTLFHTSSVMSLVILTNIGSRWPKLMAQVEAIESKLPPLTRNVPMMCNLSTGIILVLAIVEHLLSGIYSYSVAKACDSGNVTETFFYFDKPWIFNYTPYNLWKAIMFEIFNIQATFAWNYNDIIIMVISIYLAEHFIVHNELLKKAIKQEYFTCEVLRMQYLEIVRLVWLINGHISIYVLTCFGSNLYWICVQLFYSLNSNQTGHFYSCQSINDNYNKTLHGVEHTIYFTYSFSFLAIRAVIVLLMAARIHSASNVPLFLLYDVPSSKFNVEVERFISQINNIKVAMTGLDFFYVTRTMILTLLGTIVTYELVLLQFNNS